LGLDLFLLDFVCSFIFLLFAPRCMLFTPPACQNFVQKIPNEFPWVLGIFFSVLWYFCMIKFDKKIGVLILVTCLLFLLIFVKSCYVLTIIPCYVILILDI
jgi:hypothetical protein